MVDSCLLQIEGFVEGLEDPKVTLTDDERRLFRNISQDLNATLQSSADKEVPILSQDLITVTKYIKVVAE